MTKTPHRPLDMACRFAEYSPILSFLRMCRSDDRKLLGVSGDGKLLTFEGAAFFGFVLLIVWLVFVKVSDNAQQFEPKGGSRMGKLFGVSIASFVANASTALYVNNLPALSIRAL